MRRPTMPKLNKGDDLLMYSGTPGRRDGKTHSPVKVVTVGRKYVHVIAAERYDTYLANPDQWRWNVRKFSVDDWLEGERGKRIGYSASIATAEQVVYDARLDVARRTIRDVAGLDVRRGSPFDEREHPDMFLNLADVLSELVAGDEGEGPDDAQ